MTNALDLETSVDLNRLFMPRGVAVIGVSNDPSKLGSRVFRNLVNSGFDGLRVPVGRNLSSVEGEAGFGSLAEAPGPIDVVFIALPAAATEAALVQAASIGAKFAIVGSAGFGESGDAAAAARLSEVVAQTGIRIVGPNCNGIFNGQMPMALGFNRGHTEKWPAGGVSIISHSGALFHPLMRLLSRMGSGLSCFVSAGNEDDLGHLDYLEHLINDQHSRVIAMLLDAIEDGERFQCLITRAQARGKSVVVLKLGVTELGAEAAIAHSSRMTGRAEAYAAFLLELGVPSTHTLEGFSAAAAVLDRYGHHTGRLGVITTSGAGGALIADIGEQLGVPFASLGPETHKTLDQLRQFSTVGNPVDVGIFRSEEDWSEIATMVANDPDVGVILAYFHAFGGLSGERFLNALAKARRGSGKPLIAVCPGGLDDEDAARLRAADIMVMDDTDSAVQAIGAMLRCRPAVQPVTSTGRGRGEVASLLSQPVLNEARSLAVLSHWGIRTVPFEECRGPQEAMAAAARLGWPVVVKGSDPNSVHKTEQGLVKLGLADQDAVASAVREMGGDRPVIVQPMIKGDLEAMAGIAHAPGVGLILLVGLGGIHAEAIADVEVWPLDSSRDVIERRLDSTALGRILKSPRWKHAHARVQLLETLWALRDFGLAAGRLLEAVDINPLVLGPGELMAVDASILCRVEASSVGY